jgi:glycosyltransferase 2 family protein
MRHTTAVTTTVLAEAPDALREHDRRDWQRHPVDVARLLTRLALLGFVLLLTAVIPSALTNTSADLVRLLNRMPDALRYGLIGIAQLASLVIPVVIVVWLIRSRTRAAVLLVVGAAAAGGILMLLLTDWLTRAAPPKPLIELASASVVPTDFPSASYLAALVGGAAAASPMLPVFWRRVAWSAIWITVVVRILGATQAPVNVAVTIVLGATVGSAALVAFGSPQRRPGAATLRTALAGAGLDVDQLGDEHSESGLRLYRGTAAGRLIDVVYLDRDDRDVELVGRVVRSIRVRDVDEQRIAVTPRVRASQLTAVTAMAERSGARVPEVLAMGPTPDDGAVVALAATPGTVLSALDGDALSDAALDDLWHQIGRLHAAKLAHRSLGRDSLVIDGDSATLVGLDAAIVASSPESRAIDRAELLVATARTVGVQRAVAAAVRSVDAADLEAALPFVQLPALPARTAREVRKPKGFVDEVRAALQQQLGVEAVELAELERVSVGKLLVWVGFAVLAFFVLALASNWSDITAAMRGINWWWVIPVVVATFFGTVGGAMSMSGSVIRPIALGEATIIMFGQSFLNRFTPMNAGGMAMRIRYLQKGGTDVTVATAAVGLTSAASGVMQVLFIVFFLLWSASDPVSGLAGAGGDGGGPDLGVVAIFAGALAVAAVVVAVTPRLRRWVVSFVRTTIDKIRHDFGELARRPTKLALLFGGAGLAKLATIVAFVAACRSFDVDLAFAELGAIYLLANTVASAVPTPGGVGAIEAALAFVLVNAGVDQATAWAAVLLFRLVNFWLPTIPGFVCLKLSERRELI